MVKNLPAMRKTWVQSLGWEDPLEEGMATHSSILAWRIPMDRGAWWAIQSMGSQRVRHNWVTKHTHGKYFRLWASWSLSRPIREPWNVSATVERSQTSSPAWRSSHEEGWGSVPPETSRQGMGFGCPMAVPGKGWGMGGQPTDPGLLVQEGRWRSLCGPERIFQGPRTDLATGTVWCGWGRYTIGCCRNSWWMSSQRKESHGAIQNLTRTHEGPQVPLESGG